MNVNKCPSNCKRGKVLLITIISVLCIISAGYFILPGFTKETTVYIGDYSVSENGQKMTIQIGVASSIGYVRKVKSYQIDKLLYLDFYSAFGGINGSIGAKKEFKIPLNKDTEMVAVCVGKDNYDFVLEKDVEGNWKKVNK